MTSFCRIFKISIVKKYRKNNYRNINFPKNEYTAQISKSRMWKNTEKNLENFVCNYKNLRLHKGYLYRLSNFTKFNFMWIEVGKVGIRQYIQRFNLAI